MILQVLSSPIPLEGRIFRKQEAAGCQGCLEAVSCSPTTHVRSAEDTHIPRGATAHPVIRTRLDLKGTKKTHILISAALNTFPHQRKRTQKCFKWSYLPLKFYYYQKKFHILQQIWLYYHYIFYAFMDKWFSFSGCIFWNTMKLAMAIGKHCIQLPVQHNNRDMNLEILHTIKFNISYSRQSFH